MNPHCLRFQPTWGVGFLSSQSRSSTENIPCTVCSATDHSTVLRNSIHPDTEDKRALLFVSIQGDPLPHLSSTGISLLVFIALPISLPIYSTQKIKKNTQSTSAIAFVSAARIHPPYQSNDSVTFLPPPARFLPQPILHP